MSMLSASARAPARAMSGRRAAAAALRDVALALSTAIALLGVALLPLLTPAWIHAAMAASGGMAEGASAEHSLVLSDMTVNELLFGPGTFAITYDGGRPLFGANEISHMQDVRLVLYVFLGIAVAAALFVGWALVRTADRPATWRAIGRGAAGLAIGLIGVGVFAALAFGVAFELFHRLLFPGGNWAFDPTSSNLVRLYPIGFWQLSAAAYGALAIVAGLGVWSVARRRSRTVARA